MKIREIRFQSIRGFSSPRYIAFYDVETKLVRPLSVIVGSNGSGKSTLFHIIEGLFSYALEIVEDRPITKELREEGYAAMSVEFDDGAAPPELRGELWIALGRKDRAPEDHKELPNQICRLEMRGGHGRAFERKGPQRILNQWVADMVRDRTPMRDGVLFFPHNRWIEHEQRGAIEPPPRQKHWLFRFEPEAVWQGSISQLWVWQNYLDLEAGRQGRQSLIPFVEPIETILGRGRSIVIREGHVQIEDDSGRALEPHQLPSGEQQILTLFGEIVRRIRPGAVVLIDEVEISLHPALQRAVVSHLRKLAREYDLQVLLTTHSMEIVRSVAPHEIINMDNMVFAERERGAAE